MKRLYRILRMLPEPTKIFLRPIWKLYANIVGNLKRIIKSALGLLAFMVLGRRLIGNIISDGQRYWIHKYTFNPRALSEVSSEGLKLHLGCGRIILPGFIHHQLNGIAYRIQNFFLLRL